MIATIHPQPLSGTLPAIPSKSYAHRLLIAAALSDAREPVLVSYAGASEDISATCRVLRALGAEVEELTDAAGRPAGARVRPIDREHLPQMPELDCGESGTTLRYILPVVAALGCGALVTGRGRLPQRPLEPLGAELRRQGIRLTEPTSGDVLPLTLEGRLVPGDYALPGNVSSQFVGGLLYALSLLEDVSRLTVTHSFESRAYVAMTLEVLRSAGVVITEGTSSENLPVWTVEGRGRLHAAENLAVEGDWSNAAFWLCADAMRPAGTAPVALTGLNAASLQGDRAVVEILQSMGAAVKPPEGGSLALSAPNGLTGRVISAAQIPDLVPVLAVAAGAAEGSTTFTDAGRLRIKESDRLKTTAALLAVLGVPHEELPAGLVVHGLGSARRLRGGRISSFGDHRIVMAAAVAAANGGGAITIEGAEASAKSYPGFFEDLVKLGGRVEFEH